RDALDRAGRQLLVGHLEAAVAVDRPHRGAGQGHLGAHGGRHRIPHRAQAAGVEPVTRALVADVLAGPHLVLADAGGVDGVRADDGAQPLDDVLRGEGAARRLLVAQRVAPLPLLAARDPGLVVGRRARAGAADPLAAQL